MTTPELIQYVKSEIASGSPRDTIRIKLKEQGWSDLDIVEVYNIINNEIVKAPESGLPLASALNQDISSLETVSEMAGAVNGLQQPSFESVSPNKSRRILKIFIIILVLLVLVIGAALAYGSGYFMSASKLFSKTIDSSKKNTSVAYDFQMTLDASNIKLPEGTVGIGSEGFETLNFTAKGATDFSDEKNIKLNNTIYFKIGKVEVGVDSRAINDSFYLSLTKAPDLGFFSLTPFENKWIVFKKDTPSEDLSNNPVFAALPVNTSLVNDITEEQKQKITEIFNNASLIKITKKHLPQMMDGSLSYHFDFDLDKEGIASFLKEMATYIESQDKNEGVVVGEPVDYDEYTKKALSSIQNFHGEAWFGIFDNLPHKVIVNADVVNPEKPEDGSAQMTLNMLYTDWNKPVLVVVPDGAVPIQELIAKAMGGMFGENKSTNETEFEPTSMSDPFALEAARTKGIDASIKSILSSMRAQAELYFDSSKYVYKGFCSSKGQYGAYNLAITLPENSVYKCNDSATSWAAGVKISNGGYWCSDSTGNSSESKTLPTGTSCPK